MKKKTSVILLAGLVAATAGAQKKFTISGTAPKDAKVVYLQREGETGYPKDSVEVKNGSFKITREYDKPFYATLFVARNSDVVLVDGNLKVDLVKKTCKGGELSNLFETWKGRMAVPKAKQDSVRRIISGYYKEGKQAPTNLSMLLNEAYAAQVNLLKQCCEENKQNIVPAYFLHENPYGLSDDEVLKYGDESNAYMQHVYAARIKQKVSDILKTQVGKSYVDFEMADTTGAMHKLSEYFGKSYVLVDFWASWCGPCRAEMPNVKAAYEKYAPKGFQIVGVSFDSKDDAWKKSIVSLGLPWHHISDLKGWRSLASDLYGVHAIPFTLLFDKNGKIVARGLRGQELEKKLAELYQ